MLSTNQAVKSDFVQTMLALVHCRLGIILQMTEQHSGINLPTSRASICRSLMTAQHSTAHTCFTYCHWCAGCKELQQAIIQAGKSKPGTLQQLHFLAACINANAHATGHQEDTNSETGLGLYPVLSMFNHSCVPNLAHSSVGEHSSAVPDA
jgi:hypothetical protein